MKRSSAELKARRARSGDVELAARIEASLPTSGGWTQKQFFDEQRRTDSIFVVAERGHELAAYVVSRVEAGELRIYTVAAAPGHERTGSARAALAFALERAKEAGCAKASLEVSAENERAVKLYQAAGFSVVGRRTKFYHDGSDALLMDLAL